MGGRWPRDWIGLAKQGHGCHESLTALTVPSCQVKSSSTTSPSDMASAPGDSLSVVMDAMNPFRLSMGLAARRGDSLDSGMMMSAKNGHTCARWL